MDNDGQIATLNTLITTTIDSINGYNEAAQDTESDRFRQLFQQNAQDRQQAVQELSSCVRQLGGEPSTDGSFMGKTHQTWLDLKAAVTGNDDERVINSVEAGEDYLKEKFETALKTDELTGEARQAVETAYQSVRRGHDQISQIKHGMEAQS